MQPTLFGPLACRDFRCELLRLKLLPEVVWHILERVQKDPVIGQLVPKTAG